MEILLGQEEEMGRNTTNVGFLKDRPTCSKIKLVPALPEKEVVGPERGLLSLVSTTEELLDRKVAVPV
jgi:hypothetical protein